jgi:hypothetical protein
VAASAHGPTRGHPGRACGASLLPHHRPLPVPTTQHRRTARPEAAGSAGCCADAAAAEGNQFAETGGASGLACSIYRRGGACAGRCTQQQWASHATRVCLQSAYQPWAMRVEEHSSSGLVACRSGDTVLPAAYIAEVGHAACKCGQQQWASCGKTVCHTAQMCHELDSCW